MSENESRSKEREGVIPNLTREDEEKYLKETIAVAQRNLDQAREGTKQLKEDLEELREAFDAADREGRFLWNNAKAQYKDAVSSLVRYEKARKKPYFGRIDFEDQKSKAMESYYIGRVGIARSAAEPAVIDWRTPVASVYYENAPGHGTYTVSSEGTFEIDLKRKRSYEIENDQLKDFYDLDVVANDELLTKYLSQNKSEVLGEIIATIQKEQNRIIRRSPRTNVIVQGVAGSGKTTVAMHRISYILYNYEEEFRPEDFYIIGSNQILLNYITSVLPELDVYGVRQMTMEQLFIRLLYEDWDERKYTYHALDKKDSGNFIKGTRKWYLDLDKFCWQYEKEAICREDVYMDITGEFLLGTERIDKYLRENPLSSMQSKRLMLNEILYAKYENVILGKHISITEEEKKFLDRKYRYYYGKDEWKGSIFELYHSFLLHQAAKGYVLPIPDKSFDVYDLAALAYLYKRIKEIDPIREATHIVIDEAQDFGIMAYSCLKYCIRGCTYTIMGDTSQNIYYEYGLNDWEILKRLILTGIRDSFCLLRKSYRNTVEIAEFASEILRHGDFSIYPAEPIIRHGKAVRVEGFEKTEQLLWATVDAIKEWQRQGYGTIAVVCRSEEEAARVSKELRSYMEIRDTDAESAEFGSGVMVLPVTYTKGLEFDAVLVYDPTEEKYPADNGHVKMLYVTATRALHELTVLYQGRLTSLIAEKAPEGKHLEEYLAEEAVEEEEEKPTEKELMEQQKAIGDLEMQLRNYIGPERIVIKPEQKKDSGREPKADQTKTGKTVIDQTAAGQTVIGQTTAEQTVTGQAAAGKRFVKRPSGIRSVSDGRQINLSPYAFGQIPDNRDLPVKGHARVNAAVRWAKKTKTALEVTSSYGVLTFTPITEECIRVSFRKGTAGGTRQSFWKPEPKTGLKWTARESPAVVELSTAKLTVHIEKKDGAVRFVTPERKRLLSERSYEPRLIEGKENWTFFDFEKKEKLRAKGVLSTDLMDVDLKTKYISFGEKPLRMPLILSSKGYGIGVACEKTVLFCGLAAYGQYIYTEGMEEIEYYFLYCGSAQENISLYDRLFQV